MDVLSEHSDPYPSGSDSGSLDTTGGAHSDEDVLLASYRPKKRAGRRIFKETRHPIYRGVRRRNTDKWVCELRVPNKKSRIWLGTYPTAEMAARAHDVAALALRGKAACLNFADSAWRLPVPTSTDAEDIRRAAMEAARAVRVVEEFDDERMEVETKIVQPLQVETESVKEDVLYFDEEATFDMPNLLVNMAQGLLIPPPACLHLQDNIGWEEMESDAQVSLWDF